MAHRWNARKPIARFLAEADGRDPERVLRRALGPFDLVHGRFHSRLACDAGVA
jgi:hypothetical protein